MTESSEPKHDVGGVYYAAYGDSFDVGDDNLVKRRDAARKKDTRKDRKEKGYMMFDEEDSAEELMTDDINKSPTKQKKNVKSTFKFAKKDKVFKPKEKEKEDRKEKDNKERVDKEKKEKGEKVEKEKDKIKDRPDKTDKEKKEKVEKVEKDKDKKEKGEKDQKKEDDYKIKSKKKPTSAVVQVNDDMKVLFSIPLAHAVERSPCHDGILLPIVVRECIDYIEEFGLTCEGIYRISGVKSKVQSLKDAYNKGMNVYLSDHEPSVVASLLKQFLRDLPEPVIPAKLMPKFELASTIKNVKQKVEQFELLLNELPPENKILLSWVIVHMTHVITLEKQNKMSLQNVSIVLSPTMQISHRVLNIFFGYSKILFKETVIKKYIPPIKPVTSRWSLELPDSPSAIEEELKKQESLLNHLHEELMSVKDMNKEEQLWEVQRVVTQLKRKLKNAKQMQQSAELAKHREDEILQDKTTKPQHLTQQVFGRCAFKDKQVQLRIANDSLEESVENLADELDQVVGLDAVDDYESEIVPDHTNEVVDELQNVEDFSKDKANDVPVIDGVSEQSAEICHIEGGSQETAQTKQPLVSDEIVTESESAAISSSLNEINKDAFPSTKQDVESLAEMNENLSQNLDKYENDISDFSQSHVLDASASDVVDDTKLEQKQESTINEDLEDAEAEQQKAEASNNSLQTDLQETLAEMTIPRQSPSDDSSDAYTDVLDEEDTDRFSENLEKDEQSGPPVYVELQNDLSALTDSPLTNIKVSRDSEPGIPQDAENVIAIENDDTRPYSAQTTTSSEPSEFEDDDYDYENLEKENIRLMMEEEELEAIADELRQKIRMEKQEIEQLHQDIIELRMIREDMSDSDEVSCSSSSDDGDDDEDLKEILGQLINDNRTLEASALCTSKTGDFNKHRNKRSYTFLLHFC